MSWGFEKGRVYNRRRDIHARFGGSQRGGIITTYRDDDKRVFGPIFIVSGSSGEHHGYADRWRDDGVFEYFRMGQVGDMVMKSGKRAIRDASQNGRSVLLFDEHPRGLLFRGELVYEGHHTERSPDRERRMRDAIVF